MAGQRAELNDKVVRRLEPPASGQYVVWDEKVAGFYVLVGKRKRTFMVQGNLRHAGGGSTTVKVSVGDASELTTQQARGIGMGYLSEIRSGRHPKPESVRKISAVAEAIADNTAETEPRPVTADGRPAPSNITLKGAWERYKVALIRKKRSERTIRGYGDHVTKIFADWQDKPLFDLADNPDLVATKHDDLTDEKGPYGANGAMRTLRAIYNHAWKKDKKGLPRDNPVDAVDWNPEQRRNSGMGMKDLPNWFGQVAALDNPIRREFHLMTLLTGSRPTALKTARLEHLDLRRRVLHFPEPKGGSSRAFDIPLSREMIRSLVRAIRFSRAMHPLEAQTWIFAADSATGHMVETKEDRTVLSKWGNDLRQTFRTLATVAKVYEVDAKLLMNHSIPGVNGGYITREKIVEDHLRSQTQAISTVMFGAIRADIAKVSPIRSWLGPRAAHNIIRLAAARETRKWKAGSDTLAA